MRRAGIVLACALAARLVATAHAHAQACDGDTCIPEPPPADDAPFVEPSFAREQTTPPPSASAPLLLWPDEAPPLRGLVHRPRFRRGRDMPILGTGVGLLLAGLIGQLALGIDDQLARHCQTFSRGPGFASQGCDAWPFALIPMAGGLFATIAHPAAERSSTNGSAVLAASLLSVEQLIGVIVLAFAVHGYTEDVEPTESGPFARLRARPFASTTSAGLVIEADL
jgi:hypothetical protein